MERNCDGGIVFSLNRFQPERGSTAVGFHTVRFLTFDLIQCPKRQENLIATR